MVVLHLVDPDDWRAWRELRLQALTEAPYAFGSTLEEWQGEGDTEARWRDRLSAVPFNIIARFNKEPAGMVSATAPAVHGSVELISMWVAPFARGRGVGDALVQAVLDWAAQQEVQRVTADVKESNANAIALYRRQGFTFLASSTVNEPGERTMVREII